MNLGVRLTLSTLNTPPLLTFEVIGELRKLTAVNADRYIAELCRVVGHHLSCHNNVFSTLCEISETLTRQANADRMEI